MSDLCIWQKYRNKGMSKHLLKRLSKIESMLHSEKLNEARSELRKIPLASIPRLHLLQYSSLARQSGLIQKALNALAPVIHSRVSNSKPASTSEVTEYALLLNQLGLHDEAESLLKPLRQKSVTRSYLISSFVSSQHFDHRNAYVYLKQYNIDPDLTETQRINGKIHLATCCIDLQRWGEADRLLKAAMRELKSNSLFHLKLQCLKLLTELYSLQKDFSTAGEYFEETKKLAKAKGLPLSFWKSKWSTLIFANKNRNNFAENRLISLFESAKKKGDWESCRHIDLNLAVIYHDQSRLRRLYFGTPFFEYREKIKKLATDDLPKSAQFNLNESHSNDNIHIYESKLNIFHNSRNTSNSFSRNDWRLIHCLVADFYKPVLLGELFNSIYKGQIYDPAHSPNRIHQLIFRFNAKMESINLPMKIESTRFGYQLHSKARLTVEKSREPILKSEDEIRLAEIKKLWGARKTLKANQIFQNLEIPTRSAHRWLRKMVNDGKILKFGKGKNTTYAFARPEIETKRSA